jgi:hypothetical protein
MCYKKVYIINLKSPTCQSSKNRISFIEELIMGKIVTKYSDKAEVIINNGSCYDFVKTVPDKSIKLVVTSPPYNIGKSMKRNQVYRNIIINKNK